MTRIAYLVARSPQRSGKEHMGEMDFGVDSKNHANSPYSLREEVGGLNDRYGTFVCPKRKRVPLVGDSLQVSL